MLALSKMPLSGVNITPCFDLTVPSKYTIQAKRKTDKLMRLGVKEEASASKSSPHNNF